MYDDNSELKNVSDGRFTGNTVKSESNDVTIKSRPTEYELIKMDFEKQKDELKAQWYKDVDDFKKLVSDLKKENADLKSQLKESDETIIKYRQSLVRGSEGEPTPTTKGQMELNDWVQALKDSSVLVTNSIRPILKEDRERAKNEVLSYIDKITNRRG